MKVSVTVLKQYVEITQDIDSLIHLMEDSGLEVKRRESVDGDDILTLELLANRGDHHCYVGIARELHAKTGQRLASLDFMQAALAPPDIDIVIASELCLGYTATLFERGTASDGLPTVCTEMLKVAQSHHEIDAVNATNSVGLELGQPTHAFDADHIIGRISVRESVAGEQALPLFAANPITLPRGTLVIADEVKILAIAGVIGCQGSETTEATTRLLLESALFDPVSVRKTAKALGINTHASMIFERGASPDAMLMGARRVGYLLNHCGWKAVSAPHVFKACTIHAPTIHLNFAELCRFFAYEFIDQEVLASLHRLGFVVAVEGLQWTVSVPSHRIWDVKNVLDIYEEVARIIGYNALPSHLPTISQPLLPDMRMVRKARVENLLTHAGFFEVFSDGFYSEHHIKKLCLKEGDAHWDHIQTSNSCDRAYQFLKNNNVAHGLDLIKTNVSYKKLDVKAYEWTRLFVRSAESDNGLCEEKKILWGICSGHYHPSNWHTKNHAVSVYDLKGLVADMATVLGLELECVKPDPQKSYSVLELLHPNRSLLVTFNKQPIGALGEIHPVILTAWGIKRVTPCYFELDQRILDEPENVSAYTPPSVHETVKRDVCFIIPKPMESGQVQTIIEASSPWIASVVATDLFNSEQTHHHNAITFSVEFAPEKANRESFIAEDINQAMEHLVQQVIGVYGQFGVQQR